MSSDILDNVVNVVDIEATCWDGKPPAGQVSEIIEIGIVPVDLSSRVVLTEHKLSIPIRPTMSRVSEFCTKLTGWTQEALEKDGVSFATALTTLEFVYQSRARTWLSWGMYDKNMFVKQCAHFGFDYPFPTYESAHVNVKERFAKLMGVKPCGMKTALNILKMPLLGRHHNGADDAENTARILVETINRRRNLNESW